MMIARPSIDLFGVDKQLSSRCYSMVYHSQSWPASNTLYDAERDIVLRLGRLMFMTDRTSWYLPQLAERKTLSF